ncbi:MAG TPA: hypothetical protein VGM32_20305 [Rhodopila sp.]
MRRRLLLVAGLLLSGLLSSARGQTVLAPVKLTQDGIIAGGIRLEKLQAVRHAPTVTAFGRMVDPARLAALSAQVTEATADITAAEAKSKLAQDEAKRIASLYRAQGNVSMAEHQSAQSAEQVATASEIVAKARLRALEAAIRATWGATLASAIENGDGPLAEIWTGSGCLAQATVPFGSDLVAPPPQAIARPPNGPALTLRLVGPSPQSPDGNGPGYYYVGSGTACPPVGLPLRVEMATGPEVSGVVIPATAVVWRSATPFVYRKSGKTEFTPVALTEADRTADGYFVKDEPGVELKASVSIVVAGSALLLSEAQAAGAAGSDDDD